MKINIFILFSFLLHSVSHGVIISTKKPIQSLKIGNQYMGNLLKNDIKEIDLSYGFGSVTYEGYIGDKKITGLIKRDSFEHSILWQSIIYGLISMPLLATIGYFVANPHWLSKESGSFKYKNLKMSSLTIPLTSLFAMLGSFPFIGLYFAEKPSKNFYYLD